MLGLALIDMGHFASEKVMIKGMASALAGEFAERGFTVEILPCETETDPFVFL
jgi:putative NIF3 family GTP cyclohydrolase 1 type 2